MSYCGTPLNLQALGQLLEHNYFDPVLWSLYSTCRYLYYKKPRDLGKREIHIRNYERACIYDLSDVDEEDGTREVVTTQTLQWLKGDLTGTRDLLLYDKSTPSYALIGIDCEQPKLDAEGDDELATFKTFYIIPAQWLHYVYVRFENNSWAMYLAAKKFCCRQILIRGNVMIARRENISIESKYAQVDNCYVPFENYFHVGVGECGKETHDVLADVGIFVNGQQLYDRTRLLAHPYGKEREVIYALSVHEEMFQFSNADLVSGKNLKLIMRHLLVCRTCNMYVDKLIEMICTSLVKYDILPGVMNTNDSSDKIMPGNVPCYSYILDGDFVIMRKDAYNAPLKTLLKEKRKNVNICKDIIVPFFQKYC